MSGIRVLLYTILCAPTSDCGDTQPITMSVPVALRAVACTCVCLQYKGLKLYNNVDADMVPVPHFGCCLSVADFQALAAKLKAANVKFMVEPHVRFVGKPGEQWTMFFEDPSGNNLEFKAMANPDNLFAKYYVDE